MCKIYYFYEGIRYLSATASLNNRQCSHHHRDQSIHHYRINNVGDDRFGSPAFTSSIYPPLPALKSIKNSRRFLDYAAKGLPTLNIATIIDSAIRHTDTNGTMAPTSVNANLSLKISNNAAAVKASEKNGGPPPNKTMAVQKPKDPTGKSGSIDVAAVAPAKSIQPVPTTTPAVAWNGNGRLPTALTDNMYARSGGM